MDITNNSTPIKAVHVANDADHINKYSRLLLDFIEQINALRKYIFSESKKFKESLNNSIQNIAKFKPEKKFSYSRYKVMENLISEYNSSRVIYQNLCYDLIVRTCSLYDSYFSSLLKSILYNKNIVGLFDKELSLKDIIKFKSQEEIIKYCIDCKMDDLFRNAHQDQIKWLEKTFNLSIKDTFKEWNGIILFFEIRNIIIHNDGVINRIFLANTAKSKFANKPQLGKKIMVDIESLDKMIDRVIEFVTYTSLCLVAKLYNKSDAYDKYVDSVIQVIYDLLVNKKYKAAVNLVNYCMSNNIKNSNGSRLTILINKCIALKHLNDDTYIDLLNEEDWSNSNNLFLLAKYALMEDLKNVSKYMILLGDDEQNLHSYIEWPLFDWVRDSVEFHQAFKQVFNIEFEEKLSQITSEKAAYLVQNGIQTNGE